MKDDVLKIFSNGDVLMRKEKALVIRLAGQRSVLSSGPNHGGLRRDLKAVFNYDGGNTEELLAETYEKHMMVVAERLGLDPALSTGMQTAASMDNACVKTLDFYDFSVTAAVTAGIEVNGGRVGETAHWHARDGKYIPVPDEQEAGGAEPRDGKGTINILLHIDARLQPGTLVRSLVTATEAKTAAIQELLLPSRYSSGLATGSGTDSVILVSDETSGVLLTNAGKHCKLGEMIGRTVKDAVKEAMYLQTRAGYGRQHDLFRRMDRFGIRQAGAQGLTASDPGIFRDPELVTLTSLYAHLLDQLVWGMLTPGEAEAAAAPLREMMRKRREELEALVQKDQDKAVLPGRELPQYSRCLAGDPAALQAAERLTASYRAALKV